MEYAMVLLNKCTKNRINYSDSLGSDYDYFDVQNQKLYSLRSTKKILYQTELKLIYFDFFFIKKMHRNPDMFYFFISIKSKITQVYFNPLTIEIIMIQLITKREPKPDNLSGFTSIN